MYRSEAIPGGVHATSRVSPPICCAAPSRITDMIHFGRAYDMQSREVESLHRAMRDATAQVFGGDEVQWTNTYTSAEYMDTAENTHTTDADTLIMRTGQSGVSARTGGNTSQYTSKARGGKASQSMVFTPSI